VSKNSIKCSNCNVDQYNKSLTLSPTRRSYALGKSINEYESLLPACTTINLTWEVGDGLPQANYLQREVGAGLLALKMMAIRRGRMTLGWLGDTSLATPSADETARVLLKPWPRVEGEWNTAMGMVLCTPPLLEQHQLI